MLSPTPEGSYRAHSSPRNMCVIFLHREAYERLSIHDLNWGLVMRTPSPSRVLEFQTPRRKAAVQNKSEYLPQETSLISWRTVEILPKSKIRNTSQEPTLQAGRCQDSLRPAVLTPYCTENHSLPYVRNNTVFHLLTQPCMSSEPVVHRLGS